MIPSCQFTISWPLCLNYTSKMPFLLFLLFFYQYLLKNTMNNVCRNVLLNNALSKFCLENTSYITYYNGRHKKEKRS